METRPLFEADTRHLDWDHPYNPLVISTFQDYIGLLPVYPQLFGMTSDINSLGLYVALNGRPRAENLVDYYNQATRNIFRLWTEMHHDLLYRCVFIPGGEEALILGVADESAPLSTMMEQIETGVMQAVYVQPYIPLGDTSISFGGVAFGHQFDGRIHDLVTDHQQQKGDRVAFPKYLSILEDMRALMAYALDDNKFAAYSDIVDPSTIRQMTLASKAEEKVSMRDVLGRLQNLTQTELTEVCEIVKRAFGQGDLQDLVALSKELLKRTR